jgi:hypothetical protein
MKLTDKLGAISEVWNETKTTRSDSGFKISTLEYSPRAENLRILTGSTLATIPIIGLWGGNFFYNQVEKIMRSRKYATHPQGQAYIKMESDQLGKGLVFCSEIILNSYYAFYFADKFM